MDPGELTYCLLRYHWGYRLCIPEEWRDSCPTPKTDPERTGERKGSHCFLFAAPSSLTQGPKSGPQIVVEKKSTARPLLIRCEDGRHRGVKGGSRDPRRRIYYLGGTALLNEQSQERRAPQDE